jgi:hypothetical protein
MKIILHSKELRNGNIWFGSVSYLIQVDESFQSSVQWAAGSGQAGLNETKNNWLLDEAQKRHTASQPVHN